jgi:hypothetical protein
MTRLHAVRLAAASALVACGLSATPARAQMSHVPETDWRRTDRHDALIAAAKPALFYLEIRFGAYWPSIDSAPEFASLPAADRPYAKVFGSQCTSGTAGCGSGDVSPLFYFGLEADAVPIRIPYVGGLGIGFGWGYTHVSALANFYQQSTNSPTTASGETTALTIMPMHLSIVLRGDELMRRTGIPIVPYGKVGAGLLYWNASNDAGTEVYHPCEKITPTYVLPSGCGTNSAPANVSGAGLTPALHLAVGGMLSLNWLEPSASARLDETSGVHHAFLFGEYYNDQITFGSNVMRVGTSSFAAGLAADF